MESALELFGEKGFERASVEEIAGAAEVAPRTFFRYFPAKVDVLFADHEELVALLRVTLADRTPGESVVNAVRRAALVHLEGLVKDPEPFLTRSRLVATVTAADARSRQLDGEFERVIAEAFVGGGKQDVATDLGAQVAARSAWGATRAAREVWLASDGKKDPRTLINDAFDRIEGGLG